MIRQLSEPPSHVKFDEPRQSGRGRETKRSFGQGVVKTCVYWGSFKRETLVCIGGEGLAVGSWRNFSSARKITQIPFIKRPERFKVAVISNFHGKIRGRLLRYYAN